MAVTTESAAPYAPASAIMEVIKRYRDRGMPTPINGDVLGRAGVSASLIPRTLQALAVLDLIDEKGMPTTILEGLRRAPQPEYQQRLAEWLNGAYADVLNFVDPATADEPAIRDAFRSYNPVGQQPRMVTLFVGLYAAAGIRKTEKPQSAPRPGARTASPRPTNRVSSASPALKSALNQKVGRTMQRGTDLPEPVMGMLTRLPANGKGWTQADRDKFLSTFGTVLDFCFPIEEQAALDAEAEEAE
jgi:hypothetical protein